MESWRRHLRIRQGQGPGLSKAQSACGQRAAGGERPRHCRPGRARRDSVVQVLGPGRSGDHQACVAHSRGVGRPHIDHTPLLEPGFVAHLDQHCGGYTGVIYTTGHLKGSTCTQAYPRRRHRRLPLHGRHKRPHPSGHIRKVGSSHQTVEVQGNKGERLNRRNRARGGRQVGKSSGPKLHRGDGYLSEVLHLRGIDDLEVRVEGGGCSGTAGGDAEQPSRGEGQPSRQFLTGQQGPHLGSVQRTGHQGQRIQVQRRCQGSSEDRVQVSRGDREIPRRLEGGQNDKLTRKRTADEAGNGGQIQGELRRPLDGGDGRARCEAGTTHGRADGESGGAGHLDDL